MPLSSALQPLNTAENFPLERFAPTCCRSTSQVEFYFLQLNVQIKRMRCRQLARSARLGRSALMSSGLGFVADSELSPLTVWAAGVAGLASW